MKRTIRIYYTALLYCSVCLGYAQVSFQMVVDKQKLSLNETLTLSIILQTSEKKEAIGTMELPEIEDNFEIVGNHNASSRSLKGIYIEKKYYLIPKTTGKITIEPASLEINKQKYYTAAVEVNVDSTAITAPKKGNNKRKNNTAADDYKKTQVGKPSILIASMDKDVLYQGESVVLILRLLTKDYNVLNRLKEIRGPNFAQFSTEEIPLDDRSLTRESYNDGIYYSVIVKQVLLFPKKTGKITLDSFVYEIPFYVKVKDDFWGNRGVYQWGELPSNQLTLEVKNLPVVNKPVNFLGAVGSFNIQVNTDKKEVDAGTPIDLSIELTGQGNFQEIMIPPLTLPQDVEVYEPKEEEYITATNDGYKGKIVKESIIVPRYKTNYTLPALSFSYFDPVEEKYKTIQSKAIEIKVLNGPQKEQEPEVIDTVIEESSAQSKSESILSPMTEMLPDQTQKLPTGSIEQNGDSVVMKTLLAGGLMVLLLAAFIWGLVVWRKKRAVRKKTYKQTVKDYLKEAQLYENQKDKKFYTSIECALSELFVGHFKIDRGIYNQADIIKHLELAKVDKNTIDQVEWILQECAIQKYAPFDAEESRADTYRKTTQVIQSILQKH